MALDRLQATTPKARVSLEDEVASIDRAEPKGQREVRDAIAVHIALQVTGTIVPQLASTEADLI